MKNDEFNSFKISNEKEGFSNFEFGKAQNVEFSFKKENTTKIKDELNDNKSSNHENFSPKKKNNNSNKSSDQTKEIIKQTNSITTSSSTGTVTSASSATSAVSGVATVASASVITVTTVSTIVGLNVYFNAKIQMNNLDSTPVSIKYDLDLSETNNDKFIINLENKESEFSESKDLVEGNNEGYFDKLLPNTKYTLSVIDTTYNNYVLYTNEVSTLELEEIKEVSVFNNFQFEYAISNENKFAISLDIVDEEEKYNDLQIAFMDYFDYKEEPDIINVNITKESKQIIFSDQLNYSTGLFYYALNYLDKADSTRHSLEYGVVDFTSIEKTFFGNAEITNEYFVINSKPYISLSLFMNDYDNYYGDLYLKYLLSGESSEKEVKLNKINNGSQYVELDADTTGEIDISHYQIVSKKDTVERLLYDKNNLHLTKNNVSKIYGANFVSSHISESKPELEINIVHNDYELNNISNVKLELYDSYPPNFYYEYSIDISGVDFVNNNLKIDLSNTVQFDSLFEFIKGNFVMATLTYNVSGEHSLQSQDIYLPIVLSLEK